MIEGIVTFLASLPKILSMMEKVGRLLMNHNVALWVDNLEATVDKLEKAQTSDEKSKAAQALAQSIRTLN